MAILELNGIFLYIGQADFDSVTWMSLGSTPARRRYRVRLCCINTHEMAIYSGGGPGIGERVCWRSQISIGDSSTTTTLIFNLLTGHHWARCQLHVGIRYVPVASILMKWISTLGGGHEKAERGCWRSQDSMADSSTTTRPIWILSLGCRLAWCQPYAGLRYVSGASVFMEFTHPSESGFYLF